jgi:hypothetical protein
MEIVKKPDPVAPFPHRPPKPSPAGELFATSAAATRSIEACALLLGRLIDEIREITMLRTMSAEACERAIAAFRLCSKFDSMRVDLESSLNEMRRVRKEIGSY